MKFISNIFLLACLIPAVAFAGNPDRVGQAGASELLVNPWANAIGSNWANYANVRGVGAMFSNIGGLTLNPVSEVQISNTNYLTGSDISINAIGYAQKTGSGTIGLSLSTFGYGDIDVTTANQPEGGIGIYTPQFFTIGLAYSKSFADFIHGGIQVKLVNEGIQNVNASGIALDAGLVYTTGNDIHPDRFKFGVSLRNIGAPMAFSGDGLKVKRQSPNGDFEQSIGNLSESFELPSQLNIGASYDVYISTMRLTMMGSFTSNAFDKDQVGLAAELGFKLLDRELIVLRAGFKNESGIFSDLDRTHAHTGAGMGASFNLPLNKDKEDTYLSLDYGYRPSNPFGGSHSLGVRLGF